MEQLSSRIVYENPWLHLREDQVRRLDGSTGVYSVVVKPDYAVAMPREGNGFWLVEQFRYPVGRRAWEFPMGSWSAGQSGDPEALARAELAEETGLRADHWTHLGYLYQAYGYSSQGYDVFLATGLTHGEPQRDVTELDMVCRFIPDDELREMIVSGEIVDSSTVTAYTLYLLRTGGQS